MNTENPSTPIDIARQALKQHFMAEHAASEQALRSHTPLRRVK